MIGLTGGMGSGKSTALKRFSEKGWSTIEADRIVRRLLEGNSAVIEAITTRFGEVVRGSDGGIDRKALGERVFYDDGELDWLEGLLHPRVRQEWQSWSEAREGADRVVEIPLLFEKNLEKHFDFSVCIELEIGTQLERLACRNISPEVARLRMKRQMPTPKKCQRADFVLSNNGSIAFLNAQIDRLLARLGSLKPI